MNCFQVIVLGASLMGFAGGKTAEGITEQPETLTLDFNGANSLAGWGKTATLEAVPQAEWLELKGHGWDSKIFRTIELQPGYYLLTATGKGESLHIKLATGLSASPAFFNLNLSRDVWRTDWRPFTIAQPTKALLLVQLEAPGTAEAMLKQIKIQRVTAPPEDNLPAAAELGRQRPNPEIVRGCTFLGGAEKNFSDLRAWNANVARTWIFLKPARYVDGIAEYEPGWEQQLADVERYLDKARNVGLKVVLTLGGNAFQENCQKGGWDNPELTRTVSAVWKGIARRLLPYRDVIYGYDLYNEPLDWGQMPNPPRQWRDIATAAIAAIRGVDQETWIIYETGPGGFCSGYAAMKPLPDTRIIYSVHFYSPHEFTHQGVMNIKNTDLAEVKAKLNVRYPGTVNGVLWNKEQIRLNLAPARQFQRSYQVPILVGEFSVIRWAPKADAVQYLKDLTDIFEEYHWSWIYHAFREYQGWSVEHDENYPEKDVHVLASSETERAKVLKAGLARNLSEEEGTLAISTKIAVAGDAYEALKASGGVAKMSGNPLDRAGKIAVNNAVLPVLHSAKTRMNGTLADWDDLPFSGRLSIPVKGLSDVPSGLGAWFKAAVSDDMLFLLLVAQDPHVKFACNGTSYDNDCFEIFLDPFFTRRSSPDDSNAQIFITAKDKAGKEFSAQGKIPVTVKPVPVAGGWGVEVAIPLANDYFAAHPFDGLPIGFNISYNNNDNGTSRQNKITWSGLDQDDFSWQNPAVFGVLQVVSAEARPIRPVQPGKTIAENQRRRAAGETLADPSILAREHPQPRIVRGFQVGGPTKTNFVDARAWGANVVRIQLQTLGPCPTWKPENRPAFLDRLEQAVREAKEAGLKVVLAAFEVPCEAGADMWAPGVDKRFQDYWRAIAARLKPYQSAIWGYDIFNEPLQRDQLPYAPTEWRKMAIGIIKAIREVDPDTWIVYEVGPGGDWRGFEDLMPLPDPHVVYSAHLYQPGPFTHQGIAATQLQDAGLLSKAQDAIGIKYPGLIGGIYWNRQTLERQLQPVIDFQNKWQVPIFIGEFSVIAWAPVESSTAYLSDLTAIFQKHGWSWTYHAFREYQGWSLEYEDGIFPVDGNFKLAPKETERAKVIKQALKFNGN